VCVPELYKGSSFKISLYDWGQTVAAWLLTEKGNNREAVELGESGGKKQRLLRGDRTKGFLQTRFNLSFFSFSSFCAGFETGDTLSLSAENGETPERAISPILSFPEAKRKVLSPADRPARVTAVAPSCHPISKGITVRTDLHALVDTWDTDKCRFFSPLFIKRGEL
jgi:hypothetical protein